MYPTKPDLIQFKALSIPPGVSSISDFLALAVGRSELSIRFVKKITKYFLIFADINIVVVYFVNGKFIKPVTFCTGGCIEILNVSVYAKTNYQKDTDSGHQRGWEMPI